MFLHKKYSLLYAFLSLIAVLIIIGLIFIYSSSSIYALERCGGAAFYVKKQLLGLLLGLIGLTIGVCLPLSIIKRLTPLFL